MIAAFHQPVRRFGAILLGASALALLGACSKSADTSADTTAASTPATTDNTAAPTETASATTAAPAAPAAAAAPAPDNTDTVGGQKLASYTGDAAKGKVVFLQCQACHSIEAGKNMIGPSLHGIVGRHSGIEPGFTYSAANEKSGIKWSEDKLFQYLEHPQRVVPGTKMTFTGVSDPQKRADVIAYLKSNS